jgi:glycosyltransferase involved in cell wall biosynthesis
MRKIIKGHPLNIVFASHTYIGGPFVVGSHQLARELGKQGHSVIHLSSPITPFHALNMKNKEYRDRFQIWSGKKPILKSNIVNSVPLSLAPWEIAGPIFKKTGNNLMLQTLVPPLKNILKVNNFKEIDILFVDQPKFVGIERLIDASIKIYRPTDLYSEMTGDKSIAAAERTILDNVDGLVSTSMPILSSLSKYNNKLPTFLLENGVEFDHFSTDALEPTDLAVIPKPRAIYIGAVDQRLDMQALQHLAKEMPHVSVVIIGPYELNSCHDLLGCNNVYMLGAKDYSTIPAYLQHSDVALLPLNAHMANRGRSPMKLYEYAAAGLQVIVRETPELIRRKESFMYFYKDKEDFPHIVREVLNQTDTKEKVKALAEKHSWDLKANSLLEFIYNI